MKAGEQHLLGLLGVLSGGRATEFCYVFLFFLLLCPAALFVFVREEILSSVFTTLDSEKHEQGFRRLQELCTLPFLTGIKPQEDLVVSTIQGIPYVLNGCVLKAYPHNYVMDLVSCLIPVSI